MHTTTQQSVCTEYKNGFDQKQDDPKGCFMQTGELPFACDKSGKRFQKKNLARHSRIYTGVRPHVCNKCGRGFIEKHNLSNHMRVHKGDWRFVCEEYGNQFMYKQNLVKHIILDMVEKPFFCNECGEIFTQKQHLTKHSRIHTKEQPFLCNEWEKRYSQQVESLGPQTYAFKRTGHFMFFMIVETYLHSHRGGGHCKKNFIEKQHLMGNKRTHSLTNIQWSVGRDLLSEPLSSTLKK